jgi:hypothetical protein
MCAFALDAGFSLMGVIRELLWWHKVEVCLMFFQQRN